MNAVVTVCIGEKYSNLAKLTHPSIKAYAERIGAEFVVLTEAPTDSRHPSYQKLTMKSLPFERIIYLDTDLIVRPDCPNLFNLVPPGWFAAFSEGAWLDRLPNLEAAIIQFNYDARGWAKRYFNAGVMVFDSWSRCVFEEPSIFHDNLLEQTWLNLRVHLLKADRFLDIGPHFNRMCSLRWEERHESFIIHYAGAAWEKFERVRNDLLKWKA